MEWAIQYLQIKYLQKIVFTNKYQMLEKLAFLVEEWNFQKAHQLLNHLTLCLLGGLKILGFYI